MLERICLRILRRSPQCSMMSSRKPPPFEFAQVSALAECGGGGPLSALPARTPDASPPGPAGSALRVGRAARRAHASLRALFLSLEPGGAGAPRMRAYVGTCVFQGPWGTGGTSGLARARPRASGSQILWSGSHFLTHLSLERFHIRSAPGCVSPWRCLRPGP